MSAAAPGRGSSRAARRAARRAVWWIIALHGLQSFCWGLVFPFTGIYLSDQPGVGRPGVALYYAAAGAANLLVAVVLASGAVRPPRVPLAVAGNVLSISGYLLVAAATSLPMVAGAATAVGAGQGCFMAAIIPIVNSLTPDRNRRRVFARRYQVLNATLAGGSLAGGLVITASSRDVIRTLFLVNAVGWVPIALTLLKTRRVAEAAEQDRAAEQPVQGAIRATALFKVTFAVTLFQLGVYMFGYSQFEATAPLVADKLMAVDLGWISVLIAVNVAVIVLAQGRITRVLEPYSEVFGLRVAIGLWVVGYVVVGTMASAPPRAQLVGLLLYGALFALGECAYSCSYHPWLISRVPEEELTRANALSNSTMGIGLFLGPSIGVTLVGTDSATLVWLVLGALCASVAMTTVGARRRAPAIA